MNKNSGNIANQALNILDSLKQEFKKRDSLDIFKLQISHSKYDIEYYGDEAMGLHLTIGINLGDLLQHTNMQNLIDILYYLKTKFVIDDFNVKKKGVIFVGLPRNFLEKCDNFEKLLKKINLQPEIEKVKIVARENRRYKIEFSEEEGIIKLGDKKCILPLQKLEHEFCKELFRHEKNKPVSWDIYYEFIEGEPPKNPERDKRKLYDTILRLNKRAYKDLGIARMAILNNKNVIRKY